MKALVSVLVVFCFILVVSFARAQETDQQWQVVTDKLQASNNSNFFLLIGNELGIVYTFQTGKVDLGRKLS